MRRLSTTLRLLFVGMVLIAVSAPVLAQTPTCSGEHCQQPTAATERELNPFDITLNGFYRVSGEVDRGGFGFGALAGLGGHIVPHYALQCVLGIETVQDANTATLLGLGVRYDEADGSWMVRVALAAYMRHPDYDRYAPGYARRDVKIGLQGRVDVLFGAGSAFVGFGYSNVIIDGDIFSSLGVLVAVE